MSRFAAARTAAFAVAFLAVYAAAVLTSIGQSLDAESLGAFGWLGPLGHSAAGPLRVFTAGVAGVLATLSFAWLVLRRRWLDAARVAIAVAAVSAGGELLKQFALPRPRLGDFGYENNTLPSVHAAFAAIGVAAALRVLPAARRRPWHAWVAFAVMFFAALTGPLSYAHRASDSLAALLLTGAALALLPPRRGPGGHGHPLDRRWLLGSGVAAVLGVALGCLAALTGSAGVLGAAITLLFAAAAGGVTLSAGTPDPRGRT